MKTFELFSKLTANRINAKFERVFSYAIDKNRKYYVVTIDTIPTQELIRLAGEYNMMWVAQTYVNTENGIVYSVKFQALPQDMKSFDFVDSNSNIMFLSEITNEVRNGNLVYGVKILSPVGYDANVENISIADTLYRKKHVNKLPGDEIAVVAGKEFNISEFERILKSYKGSEIKARVNNMLVNIIID